MTEINTVFCVDELADEFRRQPEMRCRARPIASVLMVGKTYYRVNSVGSRERPDFLELHVYGH